MNVSDMTFIDNDNNDNRIVMRLCIVVASNNAIKELFEYLSSHDMT